MKEVAMEFFDVMLLIYVVLVVFFNLFIYFMDRSGKK